MSLQDVFNQLEAEQNHPHEDIKDKIDRLHKQERDENGRIFPVSPWVSRITVSIEDRPVTWDMIEKGDPSLRMTGGKYAILYKPPGSASGNPMRRYTLWCDLLGFKLCLAGCRHFHYLAKFLPELAWMIRNTNYTDRIFDAASKHPNVPFYFCLNVCEYMDMLEAKLNNDLSACNDSVFLSRVCSKKDFEKVYQFKSFLPNVDLEKYKKIVAMANADSSEWKEDLK